MVDYQFLYNQLRKEHQKVSDDLNQSKNQIKALEEIIAVLSASPHKYICKKCGRANHSNRICVDCGHDRYSPDCRCEYCFIGSPNAGSD